MIPKSHLTLRYLWGIVATLVVGCGASVQRVSIDALRARVLAARAKRVYPLLDDKVLMAWNSVMVEAYARGYEVPGAAERYLRSLALSVPLPKVKDATTDSLAGMRVELSGQPVVGEAFVAAVHLDIRVGWHINANPAAGDLLVPISLMLNADLPLGFGGVRYPRGESYISAALTETLSVYRGQVTLWADLSLPARVVGAAGDVRLLVQYQACDNARCLPPEELSRSEQLEVE